MYFMLFTTTYTIAINSPPFGGTINIIPLEGEALMTNFTIIPNGFQDEDIPLQYKCSFYFKEVDYLNEKYSGNNPHNSLGI